MRGAPARSSARVGQASLTPGQLEILRRLATGCTYAEVAFELGISIQTVKRQVTDAFERLDVGGLVRAFVALGWLRPDDL